MKYRLNDMIYVIDKDTIKSGRIVSIKTTTYEAYDTKGNVVYDSYIDYSISGHIGRFYDVFSSKQEAEGYQQKLGMQPRVFTFWK